MEKRFSGKSCVTFFSGRWRHKQCSTSQNRRNSFTPTRVQTRRCWWITRPHLKVSLWWKLQAVYLSGVLTHTCMWSHRFKCGLRHLCHCKISAARCCHRCQVICLCLSSSLWDLTMDHILGEGRLLFFFNLLFTTLSCACFCKLFGCLCTVALHTLQCSKRAARMMYVHIPTNATTCCTPQRMVAEMPTCHSTAATC